MRPSAGAAGAAGEGGADAAAPPKAASSPVGYAEVLKDARILSFCLCCFGFHFGNAAMLPLLGQKLSLGTTSTGKGNDAFFLMAACQVRSSR